MVKINLNQKILVGLVFFIIPTFIYGQKIQVQISAGDKKGAVFSSAMIGTLPYYGKVDLDRISQLKVVTEDGGLSVISKTDLKNGVEIRINETGQISSKIRNVHFEGLTSQSIFANISNVFIGGKQVVYGMKDFELVCNQFLTENLVPDDSGENDHFILRGQYLGEKPLYKSTSTAWKDYTSFTTIKWELISKKTGDIVFDKEIEGGFYLGKISLRNATKIVEEKNYAARKSVESSLKILLRDEELISVIENGAQIKVMSPLEPLTLKPKYSEISSIDDCIKATVSIKTASGFGSGFIIDNSGYILTNQHVIGSQKSVVVVLSAGFSVTGEVVRQNEEIDVALVKIPLEDLKSIKLSQTRDILVGDDVIAIGTPAQLRLNQTVTKGIVSGNREEGQIRLIQTDVSINSGNSGGPLINSKNEVIGIITSKLVGIGTEGIGFAIPIQEALDALNVEIL